MDSHGADTHFSRGIHGSGDTMPGPATIREELKKSPVSYVIGVAGDSGSGKSTFTEAIRQLLGSDLVTTITMDDYHLYGRAERHQRGITPLSPDANDLAGLEKDVRAFRNGHPIIKRRYNHATGELEGPVAVPHTGILILEGLHALYTPQLRELLDYSVYVNPAPDVKREWKLKRDVERRGYTEEEVRQEMAAREDDFRAYIAPQRQYADALIGISFSRYGRGLGWQQNIYRTTLAAGPLAGAATPVYLYLDIERAYSCPGHPCSLECSVERVGERVLGALVLDGGFPLSIADPVVRAIESETGVDPRPILPAAPPLPPVTLVQLLLCWRILHHRLHAV